VKVAETWRTYSLTITDQNSTSNLVPPFEPVLVDFSGVITAQRHEPDFNENFS